MHILLLLMLKVAIAGTAADRCTVPECTCPVWSQPQEQTLVHQLFFQEDEHELNSSQVQELLRWKDVPHWVVAAADGCGTTRYNRELAGRRASSVNSITDGTPVIIGQIGYEHNPVSRTVVLVHKRAQLLRRILAWPADIYLIDASGSMDRYWEQIKQFPFPAGAKIYLAKTNDCTPGQQLQRVSSGGLTEIWYPYWKIAKEAPVGARIMIISDFRSTHPLQPGEYNAIEDLVVGKKLQVQVIKY